MKKQPEKLIEDICLPGPYEVPDYIAFDLETTGLSPEEDEILEVAMVRFSAGKPVERWSTLLNPGRSVPLKVLRLTHIDRDELSRSPVFADIARRVTEFGRSLPLVGHNSSFDCTFLAKRIAGFPGVPVYDTLELSRIAMPGFKSYKLTDLAMELGVALTDAHRAYDDAEASGIIFAMIQERIRGLSREARLNATSFMGMGWEPRRFFLFDEPALPMLPLAVDATRRGGDAQEGARTRDLVSFQGYEHVQRRLKDYLASEPVQTAAVNVPLQPGAARAAAEASREHAAESGRRVLLAGFPESALPDVAEKAPVPLDYLCLRKFRSAMKLAEAGAYSDTDIEERRFLASLAVWGEMSATGDFSEIQVAGSSYGVASEMACTPDMKCRTSCPLARQCYYLMAEARLAEAGVIAMRIDKALSLNSALWPEIAVDRVLVWGAQETHRIWQYSEDRIDLSLLGEYISETGADGAVPALKGLASSAGRDASHGTATPETRKLAGDVALQADLAAREIRKGLRSRFAPKRAGGEIGRAAGEALLSSGGPALLPVSEADDLPWEDPALVSRGFHYIERAASALKAYSSPRDGHLSIVEPAYGDDSRGPYLICRALWPAVEAARALESRFGPLILLSDVATECLSTEGGRRLMGVEAAAPALDLSQSRPDEDGLAVFTVDAKTPATGPEFVSYLASLLLDLSSQVRKGLLALFPSRALAKDVYGVLSPEVEDKGIVVYAQGIDGGRKVLEHLSEENAVVLASVAGAPGDGEPVPSCLVVAKVPFPPPNPVDDARRKELSRAGADGFAEVNVRPSSLAILSYAGRMQASGGKRALVFADPRLAPGQSRWAADFLKAFDKYPKECGPARQVATRVSGRLSEESLD